MLPYVKQSFDITPDDGDDIEVPVTRLYIEGAGDIAIVLELDDDSEAIIITVSNFEVLTGFKVRKVLATGTTATGIKGLY